MTKETATSTSEIVTNTEIDIWAGLWNYMMAIPYDKWKDILFFITGFLTLRYLARRANAQLQQATAQTKSVQVTEQGNITERYIKAIDQLGSESIEIRLGGIYGLEKLSKIDDDYYEQVIEVLSAFIRSNARNKTNEEYVPDRFEKLIPPDEQDIFNYTPPKPKIDIQAALTVLGRLPKDSDKKDLSGAYLAGYKFQGNYNRVNLYNANLWKATLIGAELRYANLQGEVDLQCADLFCANLQGAQLQGAKLLGADLQKAELLDTRFTTMPIKLEAGLTTEQKEQATFIDDEQNSLANYINEHNKRS